MGLKFKDKATDGFYKLKSYWHKAPQGYEVSYKEVTNFTVGFGSVGMSSILVQWTSLAISMPLLLNYFNASSGVIFLLTMISSLLALVRAPILSMIIDNSNSAKGKFKPFLIWSCIICCTLFMLIPFIPVSWNAINLFSFTLPAIPVFGVLVSSTINVSAGLMVMFLLMQLGTFAHTLFIQTMTGIENTITSVAQERSNIVAIKNLISNLPNSLVNIFMPIVAAILYKEEGMNAVGIYRIFFPIVAVISVVCAVVMYKGTNERMVVNKKFKNKVSFFKGAKELSKNKYFWIITVFTIFSSIRSGANIYMWVCNYSIGGQSGALILSICNMVLNNAFIPGLLLAPMLIKKFGKKNVIAVSNIGFAIMVALQLLFIQSGKTGSFLILFGVFFQNLMLSVSFVSSIMVSDVLDYQQYKTNKRLEGFWQNYSSFIITIVGVFTATLVPLFLSMGGISFEENLSNALQDPIKREGAFMYMTYLGLIGGLLSILPMTLYDLSEVKHKNIVRALRVRKAVENFEEGTLEDSDIICLREVVDYLDEMNSVKAESSLSKKQMKEVKAMCYIADEMAKYSPEIITEILANYDDARVRFDALQEQDRLSNLKRNIELEEKILTLKIASARKLSELANSKEQGRVTKINRNNAKNGIEKVEFVPIVFDEKKYVTEQIENSRFMKDKEQLTNLVGVSDIIEVPISNDIDNDETKKDDVNEVNIKSSKDEKHTKIDEEDIIKK